jgi:hypothetical protein
MAQLLHWSFHFYAWLSVAVMISGTIFAAFKTLQLWHRSPPIKDGLASLLTFLLIFFAALLALLSFRPDSDDYYYVPNAVHALSNPSEPLGFFVHGLLPANNTAIVSYNYATSLPFEYLSAVLAYFLDVEYLSVYYFAMPMLVSAVIVAALIYLTGQFRLDPLATVLGCIVAFGLLLLMGETHRSYGNFTVTRAFQGKTLLLSGGIPLLAAATIEFFRRPNLSVWFLLIATTTAMVGASSSAIILLPLLAVILIIAIAVSRNQLLSLIPRVLIYFCAFAYLFGYAAIVSAQ